MKIKKSDIICIIPARGGSVGLKMKNLRKVNGKSLIRYPIEYALSSNLIGTILVSTDNKLIAKEAKKFGAEVPFLRPKRFSGKYSTTEMTLRNALLSYEKKFNKKFKLCVFLTCTDIFRKISWIKKGIKLIKKNDFIDSVFVGTKTHKNFWQTKKKSKNSRWKRLKNFMKKYSSRQIRKTIVREDTGLFCVSRAHLWRNGQRIGNNVEIILNDNIESFVDIHNEKDLYLANILMKNFKIR
jgi:CMP-N,N'-diacetyllegionaminic acid synthase